MHDWQPKRVELVQRERIVEGLTKFIIRYHPNAVLTVFGSSVNGFAFARSDLDISLTFRDHETDAHLDSIGIIENIAESIDRPWGRKLSEVKHIR